jgi:hypothetical protein
MESLDRSLLERRYLIGREVSEAGEVKNDAVIPERVCCPLGSLRCALGQITSDHVGLELIADEPPRISITDLRP